MDLHVVDDHPHRHRPGVPPARRQPAEIGSGGRRIVEVKGLGIIFAGEVDHLLARHQLASKALDRADLDIFIIKHGPPMPCTGRRRQAAYFAGRFSRTPVASFASGATPIRRLNSGSTSILSIMPTSPFRTAFDAKNSPSLPGYLFS